MALADRQIESSRHRITGDASSSISASFAEGKHVDLQAFPGEAALLYKIEKMEDEIDELRRYVTNEATGSAIDLTSFTGGRDIATISGTAGTLYRDRNGFIKVS